MTAFAQTHSLVGRRRRPLRCTSVGQPEIDAPWWFAADQPWWAKLRRAHKHLGELRQAVREFERAKPWRVEAEPDRESAETAYRLHIDRPVPVDLAAIFGDVVHNLRSALDSVAYGMACQHVGRHLTDDEERATSFPIVPNAEDFEAFFDRPIRRKNDPPVHSLYSEWQIKGFRSVQSFSFEEEARDVGVDVSRSESDAYEHHVPHRLNVMWNVDKHRRLPRLAWCLPGGGVYWGLPSGSEVTWRSAVAIPGPVCDGDLLGYLRMIAGPEVEPIFELRVSLADDPNVYGEAVTELVNEWHRSVGDWVVPRIFTAADTGTPPILIPTGWPCR